MLLVLETALPLAVVDCDMICLVALGKCILIEWVLSRDEHLAGVIYARTGRKFLSLEDKFLCKV